MANPSYFHQHTAMSTPFLLSRYLFRAGRAAAHTISKGWQCNGTSAKHCQNRTLLNSCNFLAQGELLHTIKGGPGTGHHTATIYTIKVCLNAVVIMQS